MEQLRQEYRKKVDASIKKDLLYGDFTADYAIPNEDMMNFLSLSTKNNIPYDKIDEILKLLKTKLEHTGSYLFLLAEGMKKLVEIAKDYNIKRNKIDDELK